MDKYFMDSLFLDDEYEGILDTHLSLDAERYTTDVTIPQYKPSDYCPSISEMMDTRKYEALVTEINSSSMPDDIKRFLRLAATTHIVFDYAKVADYYAHANKELQTLLEHSAMVLIDYNDALAQGFVQLRQSLIELGEQELAKKREAELSGDEE